MNNWLRFAIFLILVPQSFAIVVHKKKPSAHTKRSPGKPNQVRLSRNRKAAPRRAPTKAAAIQLSRQQAPSNDRYKEIQGALATKGYLTTEPNGQWDQNSQDAMRRFQTDQKLTSTGKLTSKSIIALGLGSPKP